MLYYINDIHQYHANCMIDVQKVTCIMGSSITRSIQELLKEVGINTENIQRFKGLIFCPFHVLCCSWSLIHMGGVHPLFLRENTNTFQTWNWNQQIVNRGQKASSLSRFKKQRLRNGIRCLSVVLWILSEPRPNLVIMGPAIKAPVVAGILVGTKSRQHFE